MKGVKITQVFADRLDKPDDKALKDLPIPKEGEGFSIRLHPDYFFDFLDHPFSVNREVADYKKTCMIPLRPTASMSLSRPDPVRAAVWN